MLTSPPVLTTRRVMASAQAAIRARRLGLQRGAAKPLFVGDDGSVCAIGAALPDEVLSAIRIAGYQGCNWLELARAGYFTYDDLDTVEALSALQLGYDSCFDENGIEIRLADHFCRKLLSLDSHSPPLSQSWPEVFDYGGGPEPVGQEPAPPSSSHGSQAKR